jgi:hypothetical protein
MTRWRAVTSRMPATTAAMRAEDVVSCVTFLISRPFSLHNHSVSASADYRNPRRRWGGRSGGI